MPPESAAAEQQPERKPEVFLHTVEVEILGEEMTTRTKRLLDVLNKIDTTEADKASRVSDLNAELKQLRKEAQKIRATINTGKEKQDVECYEKPDERRNIVFIVRASDDKVLDERAMTLEDRMHLGKSREEAKQAEQEAGGAAGSSVAQADEDAAIERESAAAAAKGKGGSTGEGGKVRRIKASDVKKRKAQQEAKAAADKAREAADEHDAKNDEDDDGSNDGDDDSP